MLMLSIAGSDEQVLALVINGLAMAVLALVVWGLRKLATAIWHMVEKVEHIDQCMDKVQKASDDDRAALQLHRREAEARDLKIAGLEKEYASLESWIKGRNGLSMDAPLSEIKSGEMRDGGNVT